MAWNHSTASFVKASAHGFILLLTTAGLTTAGGCPLCDSPTAVEVRAELAGPGTATALAAITLPFLTLLAGLRFYCTGARGFSRKNPTSDESEQ
jgi:hypothetical protein